MRLSRCMRLILIRIYKKESKRKIFLINYKVLLYYSILLDLANGLPYSLPIWTLKEPYYHSLPALWL